MADERHACTLCDRAFPSVQTLQSHFRGHGRVSDGDGDNNPKRHQAVKCDHCSDTFANVSAAFSHQFRRHRSVLVKRFCGWCGAQFLLKHAHDAHMRTHDTQHTEEKLALFCRVCGAEFYTRKAIAYHEANGHGGHVTESPAKVYPSKKLHINSYGDVFSVYYCHHCGQEYMLKYNLTKHIQAHHQNESQDSPDTIFKCNRCEALFYNEVAFEYHNNFHSDNDVYATSEEMRLNLITKVDQDFDLRRVRTLYTGDQKPGPRAKGNFMERMNKEQEKLSASVNDTSYSPPPSDDSDSDAEITFKFDKDSSKHVSDATAQFANNLTKNDDLLLPYERKRSQAIQNDDNIIDVKKTCNRTKKNFNNGANKTSTADKKQNMKKEMLDSPVIKKLSCTESKNTIINKNVQVKSIKHRSDINDCHFENSLPDDNHRKELHNNVSPSIEENVYSKSTTLQYPVEKLTACKYCLEFCSSISSYVSHLVVKHFKKLTKHICLWCGKQFLMKSLYNEHVTEHGPIDDSLKPAFHTCHVDFFTQKAKQYHLDYFHPGYRQCAVWRMPSRQIYINPSGNVQPVFFCPFCGQEFLDSDLYSLHVTVDHKFDLSELPPWFISCLKCHVSFCTMDGFNNHLPFHNIMSRYIEDVKLGFTLCRMQMDIENSLRQTEKTIVTQTKPGRKSKPGNVKINSNLPNLRIVSREEMENFKDKEILVDDKTLVKAAHLNDSQTTKNKIIDISDEPANTKDCKIFHDIHEKSPSLSITHSVYSNRKRKISYVPIKPCKVIIERLDV